MTVNDSLGINHLRQFDTDEISQLKLSKDFSYVYDKPRSNWLESLFEYISLKLGEWFDVSDVSTLGDWISLIFQIIIWSIMLLAIAKIVYSLYKQGVSNIADKKGEVIPNMAAMEMEENVLETDWNRELELALTASRYDLAVRIQFLKLLQLLNASKLISWHKAKTIREYYYELGAEYRDGYRFLSDYYQYVWFGQTGMNESTYNQLATSFRSYIDSLNVEAK